MLRTMDLKCFSTFDVYGCMLSSFVYLKSEIIREIILPVALTSKKKIMKIFKFLKINWIWIT